MPIDKTIRLSEMLIEDQVVFFIGNETMPSVMEALCHRFRHLNFDHAMNALWITEHQGAPSIAPGVRTLCGKVAGISDIHVALGISKLASPLGMATSQAERLFLLYFAPHGNRCRNRTFIRAAARLFRRPNLVARISKLWSAADVLKMLREAEQPARLSTDVSVAA